MSDLESMIEEIADNFSGDNISYNAGQIRTIITNYLKSIQEEIEKIPPIYYKQEGMEHIGTMVKTSDVLSIINSHLKK